MSITSFYFFSFLIIGGALYYLTPKRIQWVFLLILSMIYYYFSATPYTIIYLVLSTALAFIATNICQMPWAENHKSAKKIGAGLTIGAIVINVFVWFALKGSSFYVLTTKFIHRLIPAVSVSDGWNYAAAIGMGYYTAQIIGYILDCYWGVCKPQKNPFKLFLFVCFFPQLTVGPISRYSDMEQLYTGHKFCYKNICFGAQRILWGLFKKLVITGRVSMIVNGIWSAPEVYTGVWLWAAVLLYPLQLYTDFSGCMDIILGTAELFDIHLAENFRNPFFARTCQEFWQRWHMTLGNWARDYVYYPVLKSGFLQNVGQWAKGKFPKRTAKLIPWSIGMGILWFVMGFWHGSPKHILGVSLWFWTIMVVSEFCSPINKKMVRVFDINTNVFSWRLFQCIRTYVIYSIGVIPFSSNNLGDAFSRIKLLCTSMKISSWKFFSGSVSGLGTTYADLWIIAISTALLFTADVLREKHGYARLWMEKQGMLFRWLIWFILCFFVLICGQYGLQYNTAEFIYQGF